MGATRRAPKTSACQFDHARGDINPDTTSYFGPEGEEVMAIAATKVQDHVSGTGPSEASHKCQSVFEQALRVTVPLMSAHRGKLIKERSNVRGVVRGSGRDTSKR
jgi:hypothetical protein